MEFSRVLFRSLSSWAGRLCTGVSCAQGSQSVRRGCKTLEGERVEELPPPQERALGAAERCFVAHRIPMGLDRGLLTRDDGARARIAEENDGGGLETHRQSAEPRVAEDEPRLRRRDHGPPSVATAIGGRKLLHPVCHAGRRQE